MASPQFLRSSSFPISGSRSSSPITTSIHFQPPVSPRGGAFTVSASCASAERTRASTATCLSPKLSPSSASLYEVLGIPTEASGNEIKSAYRKLARICHPDVVKDSSADDFMKINAAYATLVDPEKRADYDRKLSPRYRSVGAYAGVRVSVSPARYSGFTSRNWETDQCW